MTTLRWFVSNPGMFALALVLAWVPTVQGQFKPDDRPEPKADPDEILASEADPTLGKWPWLQMVQGTDKEQAPYYSFTIPPSIFGKAMSDLSDLRLADAKGARVPYALRVLRTFVKQETVAIVRKYDEGNNEAKRFVQVSLELPDPGPQGHNEIDIATSGSNFRRRVQVLGHDTDKLTDALEFIDRHLVHYEVEGRTIDIRKHQYNFRKFRFLQIRVYADPSNKEDIPRIVNVTVRRTMTVKGTYQPWTHAQILHQDQVRADGGPGSAWLLDLGGETVPCEKLRLEVYGGEVERPIRLQVANPDEPRRDVYRIEHRWLKEDNRTFLELEFDEVFARRLRLVVTDYANNPLQLGQAQYTAPVRQVIFAVPKDMSAPLKVYFGNRNVLGQPRYDIESKLPMIVDPAPAAVTLGPREDNPNYQPPTRPLSERMPWLIYVVLAVACLILLAILYQLGRKAVALYDAGKASA